MRTKVFAGSVVAFFIGLDKHREELRIIGKQLIRSGTSVGANSLLSCESCAFGKPGPRRLRPALQVANFPPH